MLNGSLYSSLKEPTAASTSVPPGNSNQPSASQEFKAWAWGGGGTVRLPTNNRAWLLKAVVGNQDGIWRTKMKRNSLRGCSPLLLTEQGFQEASQMPLGSWGDSELQTARPEHKDSGIEGPLKKP